MASCSFSDSIISGILCSKDNNRHTHASETEKRHTPNCAPSFTEDALRHLVASRRTKLTACIAVRVGYLQHVIWKVRGVGLQPLDC